MDATLDSPILAALDALDNPRKGLRAGATGLAFVFLMWPVFHLCVKSWNAGHGLEAQKPCKPLFRPARNYFLLTFVVFLIAAGMVTRLMPGHRMSNGEAVTLLALIVLYVLGTRAFM
ncbi:MAG: hypothetical protein CMI29_05590 [Opitutae bacterium]|nr:hypothetical protein [Opitutae bacterium]